jgi:ribosomal protein S18 acetylase RimI-like enzyme
MSGSSSNVNPSVAALRSASAPCAGYTQLDNPIWNSLLTEHAPLALGEGLARRFPAAIGPLSGMADTTAASYDALSALAGPGGVVALFLEQPPAPPPGWTMVRDGLMHQMIGLERGNASPESLAPGAEIVKLTAADRSAMVDLATLTEPGPFNERTMELGTFFGIWSQGRLMAMAGERLRLPEFVEVSAVCTHPEARGRGYGAALTATVAENIRQSGKTPILHLFAANLQALRVYERIGFTVRRDLELAVLKNDP